MISAKTAEPIEIPFVGQNLRGSVEPCVRRGWCTLAPLDEYDILICAAVTMRDVAAMTLAPQILRPVAQNRRVITRIRGSTIRCVRSQC